MPLAKSDFAPAAEAVRFLADCRPAPLGVCSPFGLGDRVRVRRGILSGVEGMVIARCDDSRLVIAVDLIEQGVTIEIDTAQIEACDVGPLGQCER